MKQEEIERVKMMQSEAIRETLYDRIDVEKPNRKEEK